MFALNTSKENNLHAQSGRNKTIVAQISFDVILPTDDKACALNGRSAVFEHRRLAINGVHK